MYSNILITVWDFDPILLTERMNNLVGSVISDIDEDIIEETLILGNILSFQLATPETDGEGYYMTVLYEVYPINVCWRQF